MEPCPDLRRLSNLALDAFRELGNIGSGHASGALATMLGHRVDITVPQVRLLPMSDLGALRAADGAVVAVHSRLDGEINGLVSFCVPVETADHFIRQLTGQTFPPDDPMSVSVINELANIVGGAFLSAFYGLTGLNAFLTPPRYQSGACSTAFSTVVEELQPWGECAFAVSTGFICDGELLSCTLFFIPSPDGMLAILTRLGLTEIFN